ncbi:hypothetical protein ACS0TY_028822 [Phlomoides rotata]
MYMGGITVFPCSPSILSIMVKPTPSLGCQGSTTSENTRTCQQLTPAKEGSMRISREYFLRIPTDSLIQGIIFTYRHAIERPFSTHQCIGLTYAWIKYNTRGCSIEAKSKKHRKMAAPIVSYGGAVDASSTSTTFNLDGKIIAPKNAGAWGSGLLQWLNFSKLKGITIKGGGVIDGQGSVWWNEQNPTDDDQNWIQADSKGGMPSTKPTALRFYGSTDVTVTGITIQNSPQTHLKFDDCIGVQVFGISISSPGNSPNTDGIHLQNTRDVVIHTTSLACGDDCISIQTGCSGVYIHNVNCGPGHGISIGGLGKDGTKACVSNITVRDSTMHNTMAGVRIKTWQGGSGSVQGVMFSNIQVSEVETPIIIDQYYCNGHNCPNKTSAVAISDVFYQSIKGTYTTNPIQFACSDSTPCAGITLSTINLVPSTNVRNDVPFCWKAFGEIKTTTTPPISCLQTGASSHKRQPSSYGGSC